MRIDIHHNYLVFKWRSFSAESRKTYMAQSLRTASESSRSLGGEADRAPPSSCHAISSKSEEEASHERGLPSQRTALTIPCSHHAMSSKLSINDLTKKKAQVLGSKAKRRCGYLFTNKSFPRQRPLPSVQPTRNRALPH